MRAKQKCSEERGGAKQRGNWTTEGTESTEKWSIREETETREVEQVTPRRVVEPVSCWLAVLLKCATLPSVYSVISVVKFALAK